MNRKQTFYQWLTTKVTLQVRDEESFAYKMNVRLTYGALILVCFGVLILIFSLSIFLSNQLVLSWYEPGKMEIKQKKQLLKLMETVDSLQSEVHANQTYINNVKKIIGGEKFTNSKPSHSESQTLPAEDKGRPEITPTPTVSRDVYLVGGKSLRNSDISKIYFQSPIKGLVSAGFNPKINHFGVDIVSKANEPIIAIANGVVIFSSWTYDTGYVIGIQHEHNMVSVYKHNSELLKRVGTLVKAGEAIAIIGNSGEFSSGPHLHFEIWHEGHAIDPVSILDF